MIYFCESFITVENTLYFIDKERYLSIYVVNNKDAYKLLSEIRKKKNLSFKLTYITSYKYNHKSLIGNLLLEKKFLRKTFLKYFNNIVNESIFFSTQYFSAYTYYFLRKLKKRNELNFFAPQNYSEYKPIKAKIKLKRVLKNLYYCFVFGKDIKQRVFFNREMPFLLDRFIIKYCNSVVKSDNRIPLINSRRLFNKYNVWDFNFKVIYFDTPFERIGIELTAKSEEIITEVFKTLQVKYSKTEIGIKHHPGHDKHFYKGSKLGVAIPKYVMGQFLLLNSKVEIIIGFTSTVFFDNSIPLNISLLRLIEIPEDELLKLENYLISRSRIEIKFPKDINEFARIVKKEE